MNRFIPLLALMALCSCGVKEEYGFKPPEDLLTRAYFDHEINALGVSYTVNESGFYISTKENIDLMSSIENKAYEQTQKTESSPIGSTCAYERLRDYLLEKDAVFVTYQKSGITYLKANYELFNTLKITEHSVYYENQCKNI